MKICRRIGGMDSGMPNAPQSLSCAVARRPRRMEACYHSIEGAVRNSGVTQKSPSCKEKRLEYEARQKRSLIIIKAYPRLSSKKNDIIKIAGLIGKEADNLHVE